MSLAGSSYSSIMLCTSSLVEINTSVSALTVMYSSLNSPSQLTGWKSSGGDPCGQSWKGIKCSGSSVTEINLSGLGLTGSMGYQLSSLTSYSDLSKNNLKGDIPYQLPPNALHINLAGNGFTGGIPYSISQMTDLKDLNLARNQLNGQLSDMFGQLPKLTEFESMLGPKEVGPTIVCIKESIEAVSVLDPSLSGPTGLMGVGAQNLKGQFSPLSKEVLAGPGRGMSWGTSILNASVDVEFDPFNMYPLILQTSNLIPKGSARLNKLELEPDHGIVVGLAISDRRDISPSSSEVSWSENSEGRKVITPQVLGRGSFFTEIFAAFMDSDLSFNGFSGKLPQSFGSLSSLTTLHLQNNQFTGPIDVLANLPLDDLNVENNQFSGWIPNDLKDINSIQTGGNSWSSGPAPNQQNSSHGSRHSSKGGKETKKSGLSGAAIAGIVISVLVALVIIIALFSRKSSSTSHYLDEEKLSQRRPFTPLVSHELSNDIRSDICKDFKDAILATELKSLESSSSITVKALQTSPSIGLKPPPSDRINSFNDTEFANRLNVKRSTSIHATAYSLADLQSATGNFATGRLLGEGSIGRVYRAKYADGKVLAVKKIDSVLFQGGATKDFTEIISNISKLHHQNIAELVGYCSEHGHNLLVYNYFRNGSLHDFLHLSDDYSKPLTWNTRIKIALGTARAVDAVNEEGCMPVFTFLIKDEKLGIAACSMTVNVCMYGFRYLHEICSPSSIHKNIKSANILLDTELSPRLSDCGLATFHQRTSQNLGVGYNAPECTKPSAYTLKSDVYSFGVVMLELLTGRMPFDSSKPRSEQSLVRWATPQLHDIDALSKMVDPALRGLYPPKSLSRFADVIALCVQSEPEFRPPMSEVVQALVRLVQRSSFNKRGEDLGASRRMDDSDYY
ncbi:hypothetical protein HHK36_013418 [Tetracentron sinense]|uniref:Protein kinase domain-containing protein n=1 Tax=Tetracentron sinense TaxID=13715 RepID=A0A834Z688_TETSI|nr:hypothetical protein HHK36_013418 [Tetracentron sinense]